MFYDYRAGIDNEHLCYPGGFQIYGCDDSGSMFGMTIFCLVIATITGLRLFAFYLGKKDSVSGQLLQSLKTTVLMVMVQVASKVIVLIHDVPVTARSIIAFAVSSVIFFNTVNTTILTLRMIPEYLLDSKEFSGPARKCVYILRKNGSVQVLGILSMLPTLLTQIGWFATSLSSEMILTIFYPAVVNLIFNVATSVTLHMILKSLLRVRSEFTSVQKDMSEVKNISSADSSVASSSAKIRKEQAITLQRFDLIIFGTRNHIKLLATLSPLSLYLLIFFQKVIANQYYRYPFTVIIEVILPFLAWVQTEVMIKQNKIDSILQELEDDKTDSQI